MTTKKIMDRIRKLMAHADSAKEIGNEQEAQAFVAKVNELLLNHKLSMTQVEMAEEDSNDGMGETVVEGQGTASTKRRAKKRVKWQEDLASIIAKAHFCRILVSRTSNDTWFVGRESDRMVVAWVFTYLVEQINKLGVRELRRYRRELKKQYGHQEGAHGFLSSFNQHFVWEVAKRYREEREKAEQAARSANSTALVRADTELANFFQQYGGRPAASLNRPKGYNEEGRARGQSAARNANIHGNAVGEGGPSAGRIG